MTSHDSHGNDEALDAVVQDAVLALRTPVAPRPAARAALTSALRSAAVAPAPAPGRAEQRSRARWFTTPRAVRMSPLTMLAAASLLVVSASVITARVGRRAAGKSVAVQTGTRTPERPGQVVRFTLAAPAAHRVSLVGDFNGWDPAATRLENKDGTWTVVIPVTPGRHQYGFVIDGSQWIADPAAAQSADSDFGTRNSVMYVGG